MNFFSRFKLNSLKKKAKKFYDIRTAGNSTANIPAEVANLIKLARFYDKHLFDKKLPHAEIYAFETYRTAAALGHTESQYLCGKRLLDKGQFWETFAKSMYAVKVHKKYADDAYKEGLSYLQAAEAKGYAPAKRLHGVAYLKGWGVEPAEALGYKLIIEGIKDEKKWEYAKDIIRDLNLDVSEFFAYLAANHPNSR